MPESKPVGEGWSSVRGYDGYYVNTVGDVLTTKQGRSRLLKPGVQSKGFRSVLLYDGSIPKKPKSLLVSRLVADAFLPPPEDGQTEVVHLDGNKLNDAAANLRRMTPVESKQHQHSHGIIDWTGAKNPNHKLSALDAAAIREASGTIKNIAALHGVSERCVADIRAGRSWKVPSDAEA